MLKETIIHMFATAMALATSGIVFGQPVQLETVQVGAPVTVTGSLQVGCASPSRQCTASAILHGLDKHIAVNEAGVLRPVERLTLVDGGLGVDLVRLAQVLPVDSKITVGGTLDRVEMPKLAAKLPLHSADTLRVKTLVIDSVDIAKPLGTEVGRIQKLATERLLRYVYELHPLMMDGPEAVVDAVEIITNDHVLVTVHFVNGWTHQPISSSTAKALVVLSGDDEIHVLEGALQ